MALNDEIIAAMLQNQIPKLPEWATYIKNRSPQFKMHSKKQYAIAAITYRWPYYGGTVLQFVEGQWQAHLVVVVPSSCAKCGVTMDNSYKSPMRKTQIYDKAFDKLYKFERPLVCRMCADKHYYRFAPEKLDPMELINNVNK